MSNHDFIASFAEAHLKAGLDPSAALILWMASGYVIKTPDLLLIFGEDPDEPSTDRWFVYWLESHPDLPLTPSSLLTSTLKFMPYYRPSVRFNRGTRGSFAGRIYSTDRLLRFTLPIKPSHREFLQTENA